MKTLTLRKELHNLTCAPALILMGVLASLGAVLAQPTSANNISFQGALNGANGQPLPNGNYNLAFRFWDGPAPGGNAVSTNILVPNMAVTGGVASTAIPVDPAWFNGQPRYLGISVNGGQELAPRMLITAVPYAITATTALSVDSADSITVGTHDARYAPFCIRSFDSATTPIANWMKSGVPANFLKAVGSPWEPAYGIGFVQGASGVASSVVWFSRDGDRSSFQVRAVDPGGYIPVDGPHASAYLTVRTSGVGVFTETPQAELDVNGTTRTRVLQITGGSDLAEPFDVTPSSSIQVQPGMVMVIDREHDGNLTPCAEAYDTAVAGVISGANGLAPGLVMKAEGQAHADGEQPVAMTGRVWCWADATPKTGGGPVKRGDRLTTSLTPGHAMRVSDEGKAPGAVIGKAMTELKEGKGLVLVLVNLQ